MSGSKQPEVTPSGLLLPPSSLLLPTGQCDACSPIFASAAAPLLAAWMHLTDSCNLRCHYCYLPHQAATMSLGTGLAAIDATIRSARAHGYPHIKLKYAGGEPLLQMRLLIELHRAAQKRCNAYGIILDGVVLSNGTLLTPTIIDTLLRHKLRLMISLDELATTPHPQRPYANGHRSAPDAIRAIEQACAAGLIPEVSITVTGRNAQILADLVAWLLEHQIPFSLNFYRATDYAAPYDDLTLSQEHIVEGMRAAYRVIERQMPSHSLLAALADRANLAVPHRHPCSVGHAYLVFDPHGRVATCQMQMLHTVADVTSPDPLAFVRADQTGIQNLSVDEKQQCRDCTWRYWCAGGCPLETYRATGRYDQPSPHCALYQALYPDILRLEATRQAQQYEHDGAHSTMAPGCRAG